MAPPERFSNLPEYAFPRLRALLSGIRPGGPLVRLTIGEPRHAFPDWVAGVMADSVAELAKYPPNEGTPELLDAISGWISRRHGITVPPAQITALNGTREGLFNAAIALCPETRAGGQPVVLIPNPFYQVYAVAAAAVGAQPVFVSATAGNGHLPDFGALDADTLDRTAIAYVCSPANPQGSVADAAYLERLIALADRHDFLIFADECYSEIYRDTPPPGALAVAHRMGLADRVVMFNSLSKRSNLPGLRSGFAAGGADAIARLRQLRSYSGAPLPLPNQRVSERAWSDEDHVIANRALYAEKYAIADRIFGNVAGYQPPEAGFFLWLPVPPAIGTGEDAARTLWAQTGIQVLPGAYLSRNVDGVNPGENYIRVALVAPADETEAALTRLKDCIYPEG
ncbi:aminotransferase class I/II-fold pyridoxal phosphate-dependent enzyme [Paracoccus jiaweipingae]|uniref:aminotransferase class I/II-fold pyridoxal phosphate-dependent enzyme n=1 Tax=unclassified Paracoccus (in: a-proteobacteria) TaxID=2688777 RepID=UPI0037AFDE82